MCDKQLQVCNLKSSCYNKILFIAHYAQKNTQVNYTQLQVHLCIPVWALHFKSPAYKTNFAEDV